MEKYSLCNPSTTSEDRQALAVSLLAHEQDRVDVSSGGHGLQRPGAGLGSPARD